MKLTLYKVLYWDTDREPDFIQAIDDCIIMTEDELRKEFKINIPYIPQKEWEDYKKTPQSADTMTIESIIDMLEAMTDYGFDTQYYIIETDIEI